MATKKSFANVPSVRKTTNNKKTAENSEYANAYLWTKALEFFCNYVRNNDSEIGDDDFFKIITNRISHVQYLNALTIIDRSVPHDFDDDYDRRSHERKLKNVNRNHLSDITQDLWNDEKTREATRDLLLASADALRKDYEKHMAAYDRSRQRCDEFQQFLGLTNSEMDLMLNRFFFRENFLEGTGRHSESNFLQSCDVLSTWLNIPSAEIQSAVSEEGKLCRYNLVDPDLDFCAYNVRNFLFGLTTDPLSSRYYERNTEDALPWSYYDEELRQAGEFLKLMIAGNSGKKATNILLYGTPGTGKTSFAKSLAKELGIEAYFIAQDTKTRDSNRNNVSSSSPKYRFAALQICSEQIDAKKSVMIIDEADDMLGSGGMGSLFGMGSGPLSRSGDKGMLNSVLDKVTIPTIWITNTPAGYLDPSSRRRFDYSIEFSPMSPSQRKNIWKNNIEKFNLQDSFTDELVDMFCDRYPVSAGGISQALANFANIKSDKGQTEDIITKLLEPHCDLMHVAYRKSRDSMAPSRDYTLEGLNVEGKTAPEKIIRALEKYLACKEKDPDMPRMNLLLSGPAGSGKTEFVKYLASKLHKKVVVKMGSDLLDCYVGNTEKNIRNVFMEAKKSDSILFLDEIDGMLQSRTRADHSWEVTQVNELLFQMENFDGIMIGATNFMDHLDSAVLRRFTFKYKFDYLTNEGKMHFFKTFFKRELNEEETARLNEIKRLTPGDFRTVRQSLFYLDDETSNSDYLAALEKESDVKQDNRSAEKSKIGF